MYVRPLPEVQGRDAASPLTSTSQWEGALYGLGSYHEVRGGATSPRSLQPGPIVAGRLQNFTCANRARSKRQANSSRVIAGRLPLCTCRQTACWMSRQFQAISRGDRDRAVTASVKRTSCSGTCRQAETARRSKEWPSDLYPLTPWDCRRWSRVDLGLYNSRLTNLPVYDLRDPLS